MPGQVGRPRKNPESPVEQQPHPADASAEAAATARERYPPIEVDLTQTKALAQPPVGREASRQAREETRQGTGRSERKPLGVPVQRLDARVPKGMTGRWMNDTPGRIERAREGGYEFISSDGEVIQTRDGGRSEIVGTGRDGGAMRGYLMAIPTVLWEQDQAAKARKINEVDNAIRSGEPQQAAAQDQGSFYTPDEGINYRPNTSTDR